MSKLSNTDSYKSVVSISSEYYAGLQKIGEQTLGEGYDNMDVALFAFSIGLNRGMRCTNSRKHPQQPLSWYANIREIETLLREMGELEDDKLGKVFNEYVNGGLKFLIENEFHLGKHERFYKLMGLDEEE